MTKVAVTYLDAAWIMALRLTIAAFILAPYAMFKGQTPEVWGKFTWLFLTPRPLR